VNSLDPEKQAQRDALAAMLAHTGMTLDALMKTVTSPQRFVETLIKFPDGDHVGEAYTPNILQQKMMKSLEYGHPRTVTNAHRRCGKTAASVLMCLYLMVTRANTNILFIAPYNNQIEAFFTELDKMIAFHPWISSLVTKSTTVPARKHFANGSILRGITTGAKSKSAAGSARGQTAQYVFLDEVAYMNDADFASLKPIIMGDAYHAQPVVFATSTPGAATGQFYKWCIGSAASDTSDESSDNKGWRRIKLTLPENPAFSDKRKAEIRSEVNEREWQTEYLCEFLNTGGTVFNLSKLRLCAKKTFHYADIKSKPGFEPDPFRAGKMKRVYWRIMGVDWDKYNLDGAGPTIVILDCDERIQPEEGFPGDGKVRVVFRKSIPQAEYVFRETVDYIIWLNRVYNPDRIYLDGSGNGELQYEDLRLHGVRHPETGLETKVFRQPLNENVEIQDPMGGIAKKRCKNFMVNLLAKWIEDEFLEYPEEDKVLYEQFSEYTIKSRTVGGYETYSSKNEHIIDAVGLAALGMFQLHTSPFRHMPAYRSIVLDPQEIVPGELMTDYEMKRLKAESPTTALIVARDRARPGFGRSKVDDDAPQRVTRAMTGRHKAPMANLMTRRSRGSF